MCMYESPINQEIETRMQFGEWNSKFDSSRLFIKKSHQLTYFKCNGRVAYKISIYFGKGSIFFDIDTRKI